jgi:hypothetical protein
MPKRRLRVFFGARDIPSFVSVGDFDDTLYYSLGRCFSIDTGDGIKTFA